MPEEVVLEFWHLIPTVVYFVVGLLLFGGAIWLFEFFTPFSVRKELEEDQNVAVGVLMAGMLIALAIVLAAAVG